MSARTIVHVIDYGGATGGSFIPALCTLARAAQGRGDRFHVLATPIARSTWPEDMRRRGVPLSFVQDKKDVTKATRSLSPDIVHAHFSRYDVNAAAAGAPTFWHVHSYREQRSLPAEVRARVKYHLLSRNVRGWICVSDGVRHEILARGVPSSRTFVVYNGIDVNRFRPPTRAERNEARAKLDISGKEPVLLFFDRTPVKGGATLREALAQLGVACRLLVTGADAADWEPFSRRYPVTFSSRVADARELYWAADALTLPSYGEGFSYVLAEGAACGLPVAASDIPAVREILGGVPDAFRAAPGNAGELAHAIQSAFDTGRPGAGRERIANAFSVERWANDLLQLYDS